MIARLMTVAAAATIPLATPAAAQNEYAESHPFNLRFSVRPQDVYRGFWSYTLYSSEYHALPVCNPPPFWEVVTNQPQPPGPSQGQAISPDLLCAPTTQAAAAFNLALDATGHPTGTVDVWGEATLAAQPPMVQRAFARSYSSLSVQTGAVDARGRIKWRPTWFTAAAARANSRTQSRDPILISAFDRDTQELIETTLWDSVIDVSGGESTWQNGRLTIDAMEGTFEVRIESPYLTSGQGAMRLVFAGGLITESTDSGMFDGLLPAVGAPSFGIDLTLGNPDGSFDLDFDLGGPNVLGYDMTAVLSNDGLATDEIVPAPATLTALALLALAAPRRRTPA